MNNQLLNQADFSQLNALQQYQHINQNIHLSRNRLGTLGDHIITAASGSNATLAPGTASNLREEVQNHINALNASYNALTNLFPMHTVSNQVHENILIPDDVYDKLSDVHYSLHNAHNLHTTIIANHYLPNPIIQNMNDSSSSEGSVATDTDSDH
ncbi:MAG: hypothetical protein K2W99_04025 [Chthoniobacterales bacterium]|nr:hypothetical protein [Chthoniobacterales bacterium]